MVNLAEHENGKRPSQDLTLAQALSGQSPDPCVGKFLEFRIVRDPAKPDVSQVPDTMIPNPDLSSIPIARSRTFEFGSGAGQTTNDPVTTFFGPWGIETDGQGGVLAADFGRISAAPSYGTREVWTLVNGGGGWDHPIHVHFEEGRILARNGDPSHVPAWEQRPQGCVPAPPRWQRHPHHTVPRLRWNVYGALPQHRARGQCHALEVGDRQRRNTVPETAADPDPQAAGRNFRGPNRYSPDRLLRVPTGQWMRNSATDNPRFLALMIGDFLSSWKDRKPTASKTYAEAPPLSMNPGQYLFATRCAACHSIGHGDKIGPDLRGVTKIRDRAWLLRIIQKPDEMLAEKDPIVTALLTKYKQVQMPNLRLGDGDVSALMMFLESQTAALDGPASTQKTVGTTTAEPSQIRR
jgi:mono/diheme cytochrome c family protein